MLKLERIIEKIPFRKTIVAGVGALIFGLSGCGDAIVNNYYNSDSKEEIRVEDVYQAKDSMNEAKIDLEYDTIKDELDDLQNEDIFEIKEEETCQKNIYFEDKDGDGFGNSEISGLFCEGKQPNNYITKAGDCNDNELGSNVLISCNYNNSSCGTFQLCAKECPVPPKEICDGIDNNCNSVIDEGIKELVECNTQTPCKGHQEKKCLNGEWIYGECNDLLNISNNPKREWSPQVWDGKILFLRENVPFVNGNQGEIADLMLYNIETGSLEKLKEIPLTWGLHYSGFGDYKKNMMVQGGTITDLTSGEVIANLGGNCRFNSELDLDQYVCDEGEPNTCQSNIIVYDSETNMGEEIDTNKSCNQESSFAGKYVAFESNNGESSILDDCQCGMVGDGIPLEIKVFDINNKSVSTIPQPEGVSDYSSRVSNGKVLFDRELWTPYENRWMLYDSATNSLEDITPGKSDDCYIGAFAIFEGNMIVCHDTSLGYDALVFKNISTNQTQKVSYPSTYNLFEMDLNGKYLVLGGDGFQSDEDRDIYLCELKEEWIN